MRPTASNEKNKISLSTTLELRSFVLSRDSQIVTLGNGSLPVPVYHNTTPLSSWSTQFLLSPQTSGSVSSCATSMASRMTRKQRKNSMGLVFEKLCKFASFQICSKLQLEESSSVAGFTSALSAEHLLLNPYVNIGYPYITIRPTHKKLFSFKFLRLTRMILKNAGTSGGVGVYSKLRNLPIDARNIYCFPDAHLWGNKNFETWHDN